MKDHTSKEKSVTRQLNRDNKEGRNAKRGQRKQHRNLHKCKKDRE
jgi:hypothetical protein